MKRVLITLILLTILSGCQSTGNLRPVSNNPDLREATSAYQHGDLIMAEGLLQQLVSQHRADTRVWSLLGNVYFRQQQFVAASHAYEQALKLSPEHSVATRNLASTHLRIATQLLINVQTPTETMDPLLAWLLALHSQSESVQ